jgi:L-lactate dehydrogenase
MPTINEPLAAATGMRSTRPFASAGKIAIIGPGHVGVALAYACLIRGTGKNIALYGRNAGKVRAEVADLQHGLQFVPMATVTGSDDVEVCRDADVLVLTAGVPYMPGQQRLDLAADSVAMYKDPLPRLLEVAPGAVLLTVTNPVDVVTYAALKLSGLPHQRVFGSGTVLDSSRLRALIARRCDVAVQNVHASIVGEHGESQVPLWTSATVGGIPLLRWQNAQRPPITPADRDGLRRQVVQAGHEVIRGKGYTNHAIALATAQIIEAVLYDEHQVLPVSSLLTDYAGISDDVCLSVPSVIGRAGVLRVLPVPLSADEREGLRYSASTVRAVLDKLGL